VVAAAAISLATHHAERPDAGPARFVLAPLVAAAVRAANALTPQLSAHAAVDIVRLDGFRDLLEKLADNVVSRLSSGERSPVYLILYAGDAADAVLDRDGTNWLRQVLRFGPETGVHTVGWWRSPQRLKSLLSMTASPDDVGAFVALDVQGAELASLAPPGMLPVWSPRPGRALMFDRVRHAEPVVVIVPGAEEDGR
jgi:S-DNA-T family DNA segregation ATPase FtsK/SpoIIIE